MPNWNTTYNTGVGVSASQKHTQADTPTGPYEGGADLGYASRQASHYEAAHARHGQAISSTQTPGPFTPSNGMHSMGKDHVDTFAKTVKMSGGVHQGTQFTSDPASSVGRASVEGQTNLHAQAQGSGRTFKDRQHSRWQGHGG